MSAEATGVQESRSLTQEIGGFALSPQQRRQWNLFRSNHSAYRSQCVLVVDGSVTIATLWNAVRRLVCRHEILRTTFHSLPGMPFPVQVVGDGTVISWEAGDLAGID